MKKFKNFKTKNYIISNFNLSDVNLRYFNWLKDKKNNQFLTNYKFKNLFELKSFVSKNFIVSNSYFLKILSKDQIHIGNLRIHNINKKKSSAYLGILVGDKKFQNKGVAQEIINNISKYLFINHKIVNIYLGVDRSNHSAVKAYLKSGFIFEKKKFNGKKLFFNKIMYWYSSIWFKLWNCKPNRQGKNGRY